MSDKISELIKNPSLPSQKTTSIEVVEESDIGVGGGEGQKFNIKFELKNTLGKRELNLVSKKLRYFKGTEAYDLINAYKTAWNDGFLTPETVRYARVEDQDVLMMTDMTEGGKYILWGYNDHATEKEKQSFYDLNLNSEDLKEIRSQGMKFVEKANSLNRSLRFYNFHIRKERTSGKLELLLLDVDPHYFLAPHGPHMNEENFLRFFKILDIDPSEHEKTI